MSNLINDDIDICTDCYVAHHEGETMADQSVDWTDNTNPEDENNSGIADFSSSHCGCCGTATAGARYRMAIWEL